jgi:hypothetical protein
LKNYCFGDLSFIVMFILIGDISTTDAVHYELGVELEESLII